MLTIFEYHHACFCLLIFASVPLPSLDLSQEALFLVVFPLLKLFCIEEFGNYCIAIEYTTI